MNDPRPQRPSKSAVMRLLGRDLTQVQTGHAELREDVQGDPLAVEVVLDDGTYTMVVSPELLGWTQAELDDPTVTE